MKFHVSSVKQPKWTSLYNPEFFKRFFSARCLSFLYHMRSFIYFIILKNYETTVSWGKTERSTSTQVGLSHDEAKWLSNWWCFPLSDQWKFRFTLEQKKISSPKYIVYILYISFLEGINSKCYLFIYRNDMCQTWLNIKLYKWHWEFWKYLLTQFTMVFKEFKGLAIC